MCFAKLTRSRIVGLVFRDLVCVDTKSDYLHVLALYMAETSSLIAFLSNVCFIVRAVTGTAKLEFVFKFS